MSSVHMYLYRTAYVLYDMSHDYFIKVLYKSCESDIRWLLDVQ